MEEIHSILATERYTFAGGKLMVGQEDVLLILYLRAGLASIRFQNTQFRVPLSEVVSGNVNVSRSNSRSGTSRPARGDYAFEALEAIQ